jgi:hypothetical protein
VETSSFGYCMFDCRQCGQSCGYSSTGVEPSKAQGWYSVTWPEPANLFLCESCYVERIRPSKRARPLDQLEAAVSAVRVLKQLD